MFQKRPNAVYAKYPATPLGQSGPGPPPRYPAGPAPHPNSNMFLNQSHKSSHYSMGNHSPLRGTPPPSPDRRRGGGRGSQYPPARSGSFRGYQHNQHNQHNHPPHSPHSPHASHGNLHGQRTPRRSRSGRRNSGKGQSPLLAPLSPTPSSRSSLSRLSNDLALTPTRGAKPEDPPASSPRGSLSSSFAKQLNFDSATTHYRKPGSHVARTRSTSGLDLLTADDDFTQAEASIAHLSLLYEPPVEGCDLKPYASIRETSGFVAVVRGGKQAGTKAEFRWFKGRQRLCNVQSCKLGATMQCLECVKCGLPEHLSFYCSPACLRSVWTSHRELHGPGPQCEWKEEDKEERGEMLDSTTDTAITISSKYPQHIPNEWTEVSRYRTYVPTPDDVGRALRVECAPILVELALGKEDERTHNGEVREASTARSGRPCLLGRWRRLQTRPVMAAPGLPPPRQMVYRVPHATGTGGFKTVCYNVLAERYATRHMYPYCPPWALAWSYRKERLLREIISHQGDLICLQEVQSAHFDGFFQPQMGAAGYDGVFKSKTRETSNEPSYTIDGCAIFFKKSRFKMLEQYSIAFNEAARQQTGNNAALRRLLRGNIALVVVLEELVATGRRSRKRQLCVANTHIYWDPGYADVKLWQTWVLCQELEKLVRPRNLPLVLCGDFNSLTNSSVHELLSTERVRSNHRVFNSGTTGILPPPENISHNLPLVSAYSIIGEPAYTNYTGDFVGVLDYIWYSKTHMMPTSCLDVDAEEQVQKHTALPSPLYPSDHLCLVAEADWIDST